MCVCVCVCVCAGYPSLRIEKNDLRSVTLMEAKAKVKDIAISRERVTLRDVLHEGNPGDTHTHTHTHTHAHTLHFTTAQVTDSTTTEEKSRLCQT